MAIATPRLYPVWLEVDYPESQSRWKALLRLPLSLPVLLLSSVLQYAVGLAALAMLAAIAATGRPPRWLFDFQMAANRWIYRATGYFLLLSDEYAPFGDQAAIRYNAEYPERLSRWRLVFWKFITAIPHLIVLYVLYFTIIIVSLIAWFAILITGRYPRGLHGYVSGVMRWFARVQAYAVSMTDVFPPFSLSVDAGPAGNESYVISTVIGSLATAGIVALVIVSAVLGGDREVVRVSYQDLITGQDVDTQVIRNDVVVTVPGASDPADDLWRTFVEAKSDHRLVEFIVIIENGRNRSVEIDDDDFRLKDTDGDWHDPFLMITGVRPPPVKVGAQEGMPSRVLFELPDEVDPAELRYRLPGWGDRGGALDIVYDFQ